MFESQDWSPAVFVLGQNGAGAVERRRFGETDDAKIFTFDRHRKGRAATGTAGSVEKSERTPASAAETRFAHRGAAGDAERWKQKVKDFRRHFG
jgi:hypothetical protein